MIVRDDGGGGGWILSERRVQRDLILLKEGYYVEGKRWNDKRTDSEKET